MQIDRNKSIIEATVARGDNFMTDPMFQLKQLDLSNRV